MPTDLGLLSPAVCLHHLLVVSYKLSIPKPHLKPMSQATPAPTILEFLTHPNPRVEHRKPKDKTNTKSFNYYFPRQLRHWDEFDVGLLETIYGGSLLEAARRTGRVLPHYPTTSPLTDLVISGEKSVERLISKWNETIVTAALEPILNDFRPAVWSPGEGPNETEKFDKPPRRRGSRTQPIRKTPSLAGLTPTARKKQSLSRLRPDSGSSAARYIPDPSLKTANDRTSMDRRERFPKEYKVATKWRSSQVLEGGLLNEEGEWEAGQFSDNLARPINQAFTYCVANRARYGCILTCEEAFIFRIKPRGEHSRPMRMEEERRIAQQKDQRNVTNWRSPLYRNVEARQRYGYRPGAHR